MRRSHRREPPGETQHCIIFSTSRATAGFGVVAAYYEAMSNPPLKIQIENPGFFVLPEEDAPVLQLLIKQNESGRISELTIRFHPSIQAKLQSHKSVPLRFRGTGEQIDVAVPGEFCSLQEQTVKRGFQHLHMPFLDRSQIQKIQKLIQHILAHSG